MPKFEHTVSETMLKLVGDLLVSFGIVQNQIFHFITALLTRRDAIRNVVIDTIPFLSFRRQCALLNDLVRAHLGDDPIVEETKVMMEKAMELRVLRSRLINSLWLDSNRKNTSNLSPLKRERPHDGSYIEISEEELAVAVAATKDLKSDLKAVQKRLVQILDSQWSA